MKFKGSYQRKVTITKHSLPEAPRKKKKGGADKYKAITTYKKKKKKKLQQANRLRMVNRNLFY